MKKLIKTFIFALGFISLPAWSMEESGKEEAIKKTEESAVQSNFEKVGKDIQALILSKAATPTDAGGLGNLLTAFKQYSLLRKVNTEFRNTIENDPVLNGKIIQGFTKVFSNFFKKFNIVDNEKNELFFAQLIGTQGALNWIKNKYKLTNTQVKERLIYNLQNMLSIFAKTLLKPKEYGKPSEQLDLYNTLLNRLFDVSLKWYDANEFDLTKTKIVMEELAVFGFDFDKKFIAKLTPENRQNYGSSLDIFDNPLEDTDEESS